MTTKANFLREHAYLRKVLESEPAPDFTPPQPKGVLPEVVCPLCQGAGFLTSSGRAFPFVTTSQRRTCVLCEGKGTITDRSSERGKPRKVDE